MVWVRDEPDELGGQGSQWMRGLVEKDKGPNDDRNEGWRVFAPPAHRLIHRRAALSLRTASCMP